MSDAERDKRLALLLEASRDFAFKLMSKGERLVPFAACVDPDGEIKFFRFVEPDTELPLAKVYEETQKKLAGAAGEGLLLASTTVVAVEDPDLEEGFEKAIRVHVEEPGYSRIVLAPFRLEQVGGDAGDIRLVTGRLVAMEAEPAVFSA